MNKMLLSFASFAVLMAGACEATPAGGLPAPQLTFAQFTPQKLNVVQARVTEAYEITNDPKDVSGQFVLPPSDAIKRYAEQRFQGNGGDGMFDIVIEDSRVHWRQLDEDSKVLAWSGIGKEDEYRLFLRLRVTPSPSGFKGTQSTIVKMERTLIMPSSVSVGEREMRQTRFLEQLITDVDTKINDILDTTPAIRQ